MKVGDWVYSYSKGVWQIIRIEEIEQITPNISSRTTVHCKRFLNSSFKKSFAAESCAPEFIEPLPDEVLNKLNEVINLNPNWYNEFKDYNKSVDSVLNLTFHVADNKKRIELKKT